MGKTISVRTMMKTKYAMHEFDEELTAMIGRAGKGFSLFIYSKSGSGKSTFIARLCKKLCAIGKVYYNSVESGPGVAMQIMATNTGLEEVADAFTIGDRDSYPEMFAKLKKNRALFCVIDSAQAIRLTFAQWEELVKAFPNKSILVISWEGSGDLPKGEHAKAIEYLSDIKIQVKAGVAYIRSRYGKTPPYKIPGVYESFLDMAKAKNDAKRSAKYSEPKASKSKPEPETQPSLFPETTTDEQQHSEITELAE